MSTSDRGLLELAARAAGIGPVIGFAVESCELMIGPRAYVRYWKPLEDDGDALRLAVKLGIKFRWHQVLNQALAWLPGDLAEIQVNGEDHGNDALTATRRAIVRAAAEVGRNME